jgi:hypothetical protein
MDPDRVERLERVDFVLRADRVDGVRPDPVRLDAVAWAAPPCPHTLQ